MLIKTNDNLMMLSYITEAVITKPFLKQPRKYLFDAHLHALEIIEFAMIMIFLWKRRFSEEAGC